MVGVQIVSQSVPTDVQQHHTKPCMFFYKKCCAKCVCVSLGTHGNKETCPCYNKWKTKEGGPKCP
ncbi:Gibberellin-regulated protein 4 [Capsicum annuum]|uniref:Gibberellin-regulated protein 4 n=1 Tax=Capsicum annuum TaxID=4072 RepID=A0A2G2ZIR7_CAPAN|nr:Gibberellin-regulated protein 4 [Capsicum annuum]